MDSNNDKKKIFMLSFCTLLLLLNLMPVFSDEASSPTSTPVAWPTSGSSPSTPSSPKPAPSKGSSSGGGSPSKSGSASAPTPQTNQAQPPPASVDFPTSQIAASPVGSSEQSPPGSGSSETPESTTSSPSPPKKESPDDGETPPVTEQTMLLRPDGESTPQVTADNMMDSPDGDTPAVTADTMMESPDGDDGTTASMTTSSFDSPPAKDEGALIKSHPGLKKICESTDYPHLCIASLGPSLKGADIKLLDSLKPQSDEKMDIMDVLEMAINASFTEAEMAMDVAKKLADSPNTDPRLAANLRDCMENFEDAFDNLEAALDAIPDRDIGTINTMLSAAISDFSTCDGMLGDKNLFLTNADAKLSNMVSNCLAIAALIDKIV